MRHVRNLLYLVVGLLLGAVFTLAQAETIAATLSGSYSFYTGYTGTACSSAASGCTWDQASVADCQKFATVNTYTYDYVSGAEPSASPYSYVCHVKIGTSPSTITHSLTRASALYSCPTGQNWTLSGTTCTRPDCVAPAVRQTDGTCGSPCLAQKGKYSDGYVSTPVNAPAPTGTMCSGGCEVNRTLQIGPEMLLGKGLDWWPIGQTFTGNSCTGADVPAFADPALAPPTPTKKPPCADGEGVMTSSSGKVSCVPSGNPDGSTPKKNKEQTKETFPDGSTRTTTKETTTDPNTGAKETVTTVTSTSASSGTVGQAGAVGTTVSESDSSAGGANGTGTGKGSSDGNGNCDGNDCGPSNPMPEVTGLWTKKYPDGLSKVVSDRIAEMKTSGVGSLVQKLVPSNLPSGGVCPTYSFNMSIGPHMAYGSGILNMPCGVWDFVRIVMLVSAALLARRLVFGG